MTFLDTLTALAFAYWCLAKAMLAARRAAATTHTKKRKWSR